MGHGRHDSVTYNSYVSSHALRSANTSRDDIFTQNMVRKVNQALDPKGVTIRESRDSDLNPNSTPVAIFLDVTGSMGMAAEQIAREGLGTLMNQIYERKPVSDPHILFGAIGDVECDQGPFQVSQFEADIRILEQLRLIWLEGSGGGNSHESYTLPWYWMSQHTVTDSWEKRQKRGYLFTIGDEEINLDLPLSKMELCLGYRPQGGMRASDLFRRISAKWEVFHLMVEEGNHFRSHGRQVTESWRNVIGDRAIPLPDYTKLAETIVSIIQVAEGAEAESVATSWGEGATVSAVRRAVTSFRPGRVVDLG
jgi:hypothetical protein